MQPCIVSLPRRKPSCFFRKYGWQMYDEIFLTLRTCAPRDAHPGSAGPSSDAEPVAEPDAPQLVPGAAPLDQRKPSWSEGAVLHADGKCKPCAWYWRIQGCYNLRACRHCHMCAPTRAKDFKRFSQIRGGPIGFPAPTAVSSTTDVCSKPDTPGLQSAPADSDLGLLAGVSANAATQYQ